MQAFNLKCLSDLERKAAKLIMNWRCDLQILEAAFSYAHLHLSFIALTVFSLDFTCMIHEMFSILAFFFFTRRTTWALVDQLSKLFN